MKKRATSDPQRFAAALLKQGALGRFWYPFAFVIRSDSLRPY